LLISFTFDLFLYARPRKGPTLDDASEIVLQDRRQILQIAESSIENIPLQGSPKFLDGGLSIRAFFSQCILIFEVKHQLDSTWILAVTA